MDIELYCVQSGRGEPLLLLHGNGEDGSYFTHQIQEFSKDYRVYAIDTRGHGQSPRGTAPFSLSQFADDLLVFMEQHQLTQADILGFSDGGNIALLFALRYPERVRCLILNAANLYPEGMESRLLQSLRRRYKMVSQLHTLEARHETDLLELMLNEPHIDPEQLGGLTMPTLVITGNQDLIQEDHTRLIADSIPGARLVIISGGHDCANQNPVDFNAAVKTFLADTANPKEEPV